MDNLKQIIEKITDKAPPIEYLGKGYYFERPTNRIFKGNKLITDYNRKQDNNYINLK